MLDRRLRFTTGERGIEALDELVRGTPAMRAACSIVTSLAIVLRIAGLRSFSNTGENATKTSSRRSSREARLPPGRLGRPPSQRALLDESRVPFRFPDEVGVHGGDAGKVRNGVDDAGLDRVDMGNHASST